MRPAKLPPRVVPDVDVRQAGFHLLDGLEDPVILLLAVLGVANAEPILADMSELVTVAHPYVRMMLQPSRSV